jgi:dipeptidyl aminopeptidase/acylaminoacyl peptidase
MEANFGTTTKGDMEDWLGAADYLRRLPTVDPDRVAIMGRSYGGYAVLLALGLHPGEFRAGVAFAAPSNWFKYWEDCEIGWGRRLHIKLMGVPSKNVEAQALRSPHTYADRYLDPVLILQGTADIGVPYRQAMEMADLLRAHGKQYECVIYPGEGHVYTGPFAIKDSAARIDAFLQTHMGTS